MKESRILEFKQDITDTFLKMVSAFANYGTGSILFCVDDNGNKIGLPDPKRTRLSNEMVINTNEQRLLDVLKIGRVLSSVEIATKLGWSKAKTIRVLNALVDVGYIQKDGSGRGTHYLRK